jgi:uncharacterized membrane protein
MQTDHGKLVAILSYGTLIGWVIALILHQQQPTQLGRFHLRQTLGLYLSAVLLSWVPWIGWLLLIGLLALWVLGLVAAIQEQTEPLPLVGKWYQQILAALR